MLTLHFTVECQPFIRLSWSHDLVDSTAGGAAFLTGPLIKCCKYIKYCVKVKFLRKRPTIHPGRQGKHVPGHNNYQPGKSEVTHPNPQDIVNRFAGKGERVGNKEHVDTGEIVGNYIDENDPLKKVPTTRC